MGESPAAILTRIEKRVEELKRNHQKETKG